MENEIKNYIENLCRSVKNAAPSIANASSELKSKILCAAAENLCLHTDEIISANLRDIANAEQNGVPSTMTDRLKLDEKRINAMAESLSDVAALPDPCGSGERFVRPNGLVINKIRVPLGVVAIIYEARPNVTVDAASLCIKTGNAVILRGGKEAIESNRILTKCMRETLCSFDVNPDICTLVDDVSREGTYELMQMRGCIDVLIPRGGKGLIKSAVENSKIPVIETGAGNCHLYVEKSCDIDTAVKVAVNAKCSRPSVCNAIETLIVDREIAQNFLTKFYEATRSYKLEIRGDEATCAILADSSAANEDDYATEFNDYIIAVKVSDGIDSAIKHINAYSTGHSETIMTQNISAAKRFQNEINSAAVYVNASTRFTDGGEFGFGAEIGISTQKLHARGPMGLNELTTVKYLIIGEGQIR